MYTQSKRVGNILDPSTCVYRGAKLPLKVIEEYKDAKNTYKGL